MWQDNRNGNWDIYAYNLATQETVPITSHERDQVHPAISGTVVVWEDYRHGLGEIYRFDLVTRAETRVTFDQENQTQPVVSGTTVVWAGERNGQKDVYSYDPVRGSLRVSYGPGEHNQAAVQNDLLVYTDYESGFDDPNLSFRVLTSGAGGRLVVDPARQEEPAIGDKVVIWQDNREGKYQIYVASFDIEVSPIEAELRPGFNLIAVGDWLASQYPTASTLLSSKGSELGIERLLAHDAVHNTYTEATLANGDSILSKGMGVIVYVQKPGVLKLAESGETGIYNLLAGSNQIGMLAVPFGYSAYDMMKSVGLDNIQSLRRFDSTTGAWQTVSVRRAGGENTLAGTNFAIHQGDGLVLTMKTRVDGWQP